MNVEETKYYKRPDGDYLKLEIFRDEDPYMSDDEGQLAHMVCFHARYQLGDRHPYTNDRDGMEEFLKWAKTKLDHREIVIASVELYDHSGLSVHIYEWGYSCLTPKRTGFDSGIVGWVYAEKKEVIDELQVSESEWGGRAEELIANRVVAYDQYLTGEVYGFELSEMKHETVERGGKQVTSYWNEWTLVDSCWGFFGNDHKKSGIMDYIPEDAAEIDEAGLPDTVPDHTLAEALEDIRWNCEHCEARLNWKKVGTETPGPCTKCRLKKYGFSEE